jgi:exodeoxyribonuclease V alpha subunit
MSTQKKLFLDGPAPSHRGSGQGAASSAPALVTIKGYIDKIKWSDAESGRSILSVRTDEGALVILMGSPGFVPGEGKRVLAQAKVEHHSTFGDQYVADIIQEELPADREGVIAYLSAEVDGVGKTMAARIFDHFGKGTLEILDEDPSRLKEVPGIGAAKLATITASWKQNSTIRKVWTMLGQHGIGGSLPGKIVNAFGDRALEVLQKNPYQCTAIDGIGFLKADSIARATGIKPDAPIRIAGAVRFALKDVVAKNGHTAVSRANLVEHVMQLARFDDELLESVEGVLDYLLERGHLVERTLGENSCISTKTVVVHEKKVGERLLALAKACGENTDLKDAAAIRLAALNDEDQSRAVLNAFTYGVTVITGRPGCGKTTVTKEIVEVADAAGLEVVLCAPSGKAARRLSDATGFEAKTIHATLVVEAGHEGFVHDEDHKLKGDVFIVDEASMADLSLARSFLEAIPDGARLVLVGDSDQLPSVTPGNVLFDIIASNRVPVTTLKTPHRAALSSDITVNAYKIADGNTKGFDLNGKRDLQFANAIDDVDVINEVTRAYRELIARYRSENVQVMASRHGTPVGVTALNDILREISNPASPSKAVIQHGSTFYRVGDRVIRSTTDKKLKVSNGEVGTIKSVEADGKACTINFGDRDVKHERRDLGGLDLAYAITIHRSQGSEFAGVVLVMPRAHKFMLNRNLFYTGVTRGKKDVRIVGSPDAIYGAISKRGSVRVTGLGLEIHGAFGEFMKEVNGPLASVPTIVPDAPLPIPDEDTTALTGLRVSGVRSSNPPVSVARDPLSGGRSVRQRVF